MTDRPDLFLLNVAFDTTGVHGHAFFRDPNGTDLRQVIIHGNAIDDYVCEPAHGDTRDGWEPFVTEAQWLVALIRPDTPGERD